MPAIKNLDQFYIERPKTDALVVSNSNMLYTWALLPARIDSKDEAAQILDATLATHSTYTYEELQAVLDMLMSDNRLNYERVVSMVRSPNDFNFTLYGDYLLYAQSSGHIHFNLYVFCAEYRMYLSSVPYEYRLVGGIADAGLPDEILKRAIELAEESDNE